MVCSCSATITNTDDYLCQECRDYIDGMTYCEDCNGRYAKDGNLKCHVCRHQEKCEYCNQQYEPLVLLREAKSNGIRFKGLCADCRKLAIGSVEPLTPIVTPDWEYFQICPDCGYHEETYT